MRLQSTRITMLPEGYRIIIDIIESLQPIGREVRKVVFFAVRFIVVMLIKMCANINSFPK